MSEIRTNTISNVAGTGPATLTGQSAAKAWVQGSDAASVTEGFNVSSGTDHGAGDYSYALTSAMSSTTYSQLTMCKSAVAYISQQNDDRDTASVMAIATFTSSGGAADSTHSGVIHGDLA